jgi:hypothetical protein
MVSVELNQRAWAIGRCPLGKRRVLRRQRPTGPARRRTGTGWSTPRATRCPRIRPTVLSDTVTPWARNSTVSLARPHIGKSSRNRWTASTSAEGHLGCRTRRGRRERGARRSTPPWALRRQR